MNTTLFDISRKAVDPTLVNEIVMAVDFGASGGFAWNINGLIETMDMPRDYRDVSKLFGRIKPSLLVGEDIHAFAGQGSVSIATLLRGVGRIEGMAAPWGIPIELIAPQAWIPWYGIGKSSNFVTASGKKDKPAWKRHLLSHARKLFPDTDLTLGSADAILLWNYYLSPEKKTRLSPFRIKQ